MPNGQKVVQVPGVGNIAFPGTMDDAAINQAITNHLAAQKPGAFQQRPGGPVMNSNNFPAPAPSTESDMAKRLRGATLGLAEGAGIQPELHGWDVIKNTLSNFGSGVKNLAGQSFSESQKWLGEKGYDSPLSLAATPVNMLAHVIENSATGLKKTGTEASHAVQGGDLEGLYHALGSGAGQVAMLRSAGDATTGSPLGDFRKGASEIMNEGPSKVRVLSDQHAHAIATQQHIAKVADAVHSDAQQAMASVAGKVDAAKPQGVFDKTDVGNRIQTAIGDTVSDTNQLPKAARELLPKEPAGGKSTGPTVGGRHFDLSNPSDLRAFQNMKAQGVFSPAEIQRMEGGSTGEMHSFSDLQQARSALGRQMQNLEGAPKAAANAAYGELSKILREGAKDAGVEPDWIDANARYKGYMDDFVRSPIKKTLFGENAHDIMHPLTGDSRMQTLNILSKYEPFGMDIQKLNQEVGAFNLGSKTLKLGEPTKRTALIAAISPKVAAASVAIPRMLRNPDLTRGIMGEGFEAPEIKPRMVYPTKEAAAAALKGKGPTPPPESAPPVVTPPKNTPVPPKPSSLSGASAKPTLESAKTTLDEQLKPWTQRLGENRASLQKTIDDPASSAADKADAKARMRKLGGQRVQDTGAPEGTRERRHAPEKVAQ